MLIHRLRRWTSITTILDKRLVFAGMILNSNRLFSGTPITGTLTGSECDCSGLMNEYVVLGVIIWAVILTLVTIVMIVMATNVTGARRI